MKSNIPNVLNGNYWTFFYSEIEVGRGAWHPCPPVDDIKRTIISKRKKQQLHEIFCQNTLDVV